MLSINNITVRVAGRPLIENGTAVVYEGHKVALVGRNGAGKSTLLSVIGGLLQTDTGEVSYPSTWSMGWTKQEAPDGDEALIETVLAADLLRSELLVKAETAPPEQLAEVHEQLNAIDAHTAPARAARILAGLGFDDAAQQRPCSSFSGGWRMRVALASLLFTQPDLLLLDEPTNHLDLEATVWLEDYLKKYRGTIVLVSHDKRLLNAVPNSIIHLSGLKLTTYGGNYDRFRKTRAEQMELTAKRAVKVDAQRKHMEAFVERFRYSAAKAKQAQSRLKALEKMETVVVERDEDAIDLTFPTPGELAPPLFTAEKVAIGYDAKPVLTNLNLRLDPADRVALLGANGNGKSTLIKLLAGRIELQGGDIHRSEKLRVGYFAQHLADDLPMHLTAKEAMQALEPKWMEKQVRARLGAFGFSGERVDTKIDALSGGEKARLLFCFVSRTEPHVLLLDEPTNHLDIETREALIQAVNSFAGAVVLVSHDPTLVELIAEELWLVADGTVERFRGDLAAYEALLLEKRGSGGATSASKSTGKSGGNKPEAKPENFEEKRTARAERAKIERKLGNIERDITKLTEHAGKLETALADPTLYDGSKPGRAAAYQAKLDTVRAQISGLEDDWVELEEQLDA